MIKVLKSGLSSSIQDLGRLEYRDFGVPHSGAMDMKSMETANLLLGNSLNDAVLEMTMIGATLQFLVSTSIVISGADMSPELNGKLILSNRVILVNSGDVLSFSTVASGFFTYLAVYGGFKTEMVLNSRSFYDDITKKSRIQDGDILKISEFSSLFYTNNTNSKIKSYDFTISELDVFKGPEFDMLVKENQNKLLTSEFKVSKFYNRMAYQLESKIQNNLKSILTSPVLPGTVQLTPSGQLIVLMRDCQTTGGYPRVLQFSEKAINLLAQKKERDKVKFNLIEFP
ncbi:biotin-dependent carboxyltransferase family protein [Winogradskyella litorisediminis]|uniref:Biotin-dependent carboxyltransferase family protein n=1 Tax=Winogradskyella litorisediminis TaxID=1156618 RepID=A0ABW3NAR0_9FLAO